MRLHGNGERLALGGLLALVIATAPGRALAGDGPYVPMLDDESCWKALPKTESGGGGPLPAWARAVAVSLPRTAAALLELDLAHRTRSPIDPKLRAAMRRVAASENGCAYAVAYAEADARRAGLSDDALEALRRGDLDGFSEPERLALAFARKMTRESSRVTDEEFAALVAAFGERATAAMVLGMAYANFQDRLLNCLGVTVEEGGPLPPVEVRFVPGGLETKTSPPPPVSNEPLPAPTGRDLIDDDPEWSALSFETLQERLEAQRRRATRLRIPEWSEVERGLPKNFTGPNRIVWNLICLGYAPELAMPWEVLMRTNSAENGRRLNRVFTLSVFWIVTRSLDCPYCMGHCEMNWEVAGLAPERIAERTRLLAGADWSSFPPEQQRAFAFTRKLTRAPGSISAADTRALQQDFGNDAALSLLIYACRCNYMTRISNGFGLTLERDNVFYEYYGVPRPADVKPAQ